MPYNNNNDEDSQRYTYTIGHEHFGPIKGDFLDKKIMLKVKDKEKVKCIPFQSYIVQLIFHGVTVIIHTTAYFRQLHGSASNLEN